MRINILAAAGVLPLLACAPEHEPTAPGSEPSLAVSAATDYRAINLGTLGGPVSIAYGVSPAGHIVGESWTGTSTPNEHAFIWYDGVMRDLGTLGGCCSTALAVNRGGKVVGSSTTAGGVEHAFVWKDGVMRDLGPWRTPRSVATDINAIGQIVVEGGGGFLLHRDLVTDLGWFLPAAINADGWIVGEATAEGQRAALWKEGVLQSLGTLGGSFSSATDINRHGVIVGVSTLGNGNLRAFIYRDGAMRNLGVQGVASAAHGLNDAGVVVGSRAIKAGPTRAFIWRNGVVQDLPSLGGKYSTAEDINANGWIVGQSRSRDGDGGGPFATLWVPK